MTLQAEDRHLAPVPFRKDCMENDIQVLGFHVCPIHRQVKELVNGNWVCPDCPKVVIKKLKKKK